MKKSRLYYLSVLVIGVLISVSLLPLRIYAQSLTSPFLGINFQVTAYGENASSITLPKINIEYIGSTVPSGYISGQLNCTTPSTPSSSTPCDVFQFQNTSGQSGTGNGTRIYLNLQNYLLEANGNATINHQSYFFIDYEFILDDNYKGYVTITDEDNNTKTIYVNGNEFHYQRMQLDTTEKSITIDEYQLNRVTESIIWNFPVETLSAINTLITASYQYVKLTPLFDNTYYMYPIFEILNSNVVLHQSGWETIGKKYYLIFGINKAVDNGNIGNYLTFENCHMIDFEYIQNLVNSAYKIVKITLINDNGMSFIVKSKSQYEYMPIYFNNINDKHISTEFAELFGLMGYQESSSNLDNTTSQFTSDSNDLITIEDTFNNSMNNALQNVSPTFNMGQSFLNSANWVSTQFNRIVNNTPFASLITFGLTLGLGLLIIGKVRK